MGKPVTVAAHNISQANQYIQDFCIRGPNDPMVDGPNTILMSPQLRGNQNLNMGNINAKMCVLDVDPNLSGNSDLNIGNIQAGGGVNLGGSISGNAQENIQGIYTLQNLALVDCRNHISYGDYSAGAPCGYSYAHYLH